MSGATATDATHLGDRSDRSDRPLTQRLVSIVVETSGRRITAVDAPPQQDGTSWNMMFVHAQSTGRR